jgi:prephenate dehydratase
MTNIKIAYFGHPGSFSYLAALKYIKKRGFKDCLLFPCQSFHEVLDYVLVGECIGIIPYYNAAAGYVAGHESLDHKYKDLVRDEVSLLVHHNLISLKSARTSRLTQVASHPQALLQCKLYLKNRYPKLRQVPYCTTSTAAYDLANGILPAQSAIIASAEAAKKYGIRIIDSDIEDSPNNQTYFKVLHK